MNRLLEQESFKHHQQLPGIFIAGDSASVPEAGALSTQMGRLLLVCLGSLLNPMAWMVLGILCVLNRGGCPS
jgi:hypothetical protein